MHSQCGGQKVDIAGVVDRDHGAAVLGDVLLAAVADPGPGGQDAERGRDLEHAERRLNHEYLLRRPCGLLTVRRSHSCLLGVQAGRLGQRRSTAAQPARHPELAGRVRSVLLLCPFQQMLHPRVQQTLQFRQCQRRLDRFTDETP